jgi:hypothetical protein
VFRILTHGAGYFAHVFIAGFVLGVVRVSWLEPSLGERTAELIEAPLMLAVIAMASRVRVRRHPHTTPAQWLGIGTSALVFMLAMEFTVVLALREKSIAEYVSGRDPVGGAVYVVLLLLFAAMPFLWSRSAAPKGQAGTGPD